MIGIALDVFNAGKSMLARSINEIVGPVVNARREAQRDLHQVTSGLRTEAQLIPLLVEQLALLNANLSALNEVLRPVATVERTVVSAEHRLVHGLFRRHGSPTAADS